MLGQKEMAVDFWWGPKQMNAFFVKIMEKSSHFNRFGEALTNET